MTFLQKPSEKLTYFHYLDLFKKNPEKYDGDYQVILRDIDEGRTDINVWNYSMRSFLHKLQTQNKISLIEARENMKHVLEALMVKYPQIGYCQGMNYIIAFILSFANEEQTFELFSDLIDRVLPSHFFQKSEKGTGLLGVLAEAHVLKRLLTDAQLFKTAQELEKAQDFLDLKAPQWLLSLLVNILDLEGTYHIFNMLFEWGIFSQVEKAILLIVQKKLDEFLGFNNDSSRITDSITRDINLTVFQQISEIPVDEQMRNHSYLEYMKGFAEKWNKTDKVTYWQLEKITYFSKEEIKLLQKEFLFLIDSRKKHQSKKDKFFFIDKEILSQEENEKKIERNIENEAKQGNIMEIKEKKMETIEKKNRNETKSEKKRRSKIKGITKSDFGVIMALMNKNENQESELKGQDLDRIFEVFDEDKSGTLDFREFLCCMSLLMRGTLNEKLEMCFNVFDKDNKGFLKNEEAVKMIESLINSLTFTFDGEKEFSKEELKGFKEKLREMIKGKENVVLLGFNCAEMNALVKELGEKTGIKNKIKL